MKTFLIKNNVYLNEKEMHLSKFLNNVFQEGFFKQKTNFRKTILSHQSMKNVTRNVAIVNRWYIILPAVFIVSS